jgi:hypothetical protein
MTYEVIQYRGRFAVSDGQEFVSPCMEDLEEARAWKADLEEADDEIDEDETSTVESE